MTQSPEAVLLLTHFLDERIVTGFRRLRDEVGSGRDVWVLFNLTDDNNPGFAAPPDLRVFGFREADLRALNYPRKGRAIRDVDIELFSFPFQRAHPHYGRVWVVEYDVEFTGRWATVFDHFRDDDADLLATNLHRHADNPGWENWSSVRGPAGRPPRETLLRAFMPFSRLSSRAYHALDTAYGLGWQGHYECLVPTLLTAAGLVIEDIGGSGEFVRPGNVERFYTSTPSVNDLSPGSFVFRPVMAAPGERPDTLWHPVKPPSTAYVRGWRNGRLGVLARRANRLSQSVARLWGMGG